MNQERSLITGKTIIGKTITAVTVVAALLALITIVAAAANAAPDKKDKTVGRLLYGKVLDPRDNPLPDSVVYLTNTRNRAVKTYIVGAQYKGKKSDTKSVSQFDDRSQVYLDLKIDIR